MNIEVSTYYELFHLLQTQPMFNVLKNVHQMNVNRLRKNKKIKIAFQVTSLSIWCTDFMPKLLSAIEKFDITIVITWQQNTVYEQEIPPVIEYFKNSGLKYCIADGSVQPGDFDIVFYLSPYLEALANWTDKEIPLTTLLCYLPYGYCVEKINGIYKLMVEPEAAKIVRRIFEEYASGDGIQSIIDRLFEDRVHRISDYNQYHHVYCQDGENLHQWGNSSIRAVLNRNNYYGDLVQRKYESRFQRGEKWCDILDESQWIITPNAHEPIISRELFEKAQVRLKAAQQKATKTTEGWEDDERAFYNVFYCGDCKRKMCTRRCKGNVYYFCNAAWYRDERKCRQKSISEDKLQKIVRSELTRQFQLSGLRKKDMSAISSSVFLSKIKEIQTEIRKLDADMERRSEKLAQAFMQYKEGELSKEAYIEMKDDRNNWKAFCEERKKFLEQTIRKLEKQQKEEARFLRSLLELDGTTRINAELAEGLIDSMYLYGDGRLEINFGFKGAVEHE